MNCPRCGNGEIIAHLRFDYMLPLLRGGGVSPPPVKVAEMKALWDKMAEDKRVISCTNCDQAYRYFKGKGLVKVEDVPEEETTV